VDRAPDLADALLSPYERLPQKVATVSDFFETYVKETQPFAFRGAG
jgi:hypothetical protein